jgi:hypothetical protein
LSFLYTNGERLITAETIKDLVVHTEERGILWNALRERALHSGGYQVGELPEFPLDVDILKFFGISEIK